MHWMFHSAIAFLGGVTGLALWYPASCLPGLNGASFCQNILGQALPAGASTGWEAKAGGLALLGAIVSAVWEWVSKPR